MKKILLVLIATLCSVALNAQDSGREIVYLNGGGYTTSHNNLGVYSGLEYNRQLKGNWYWGARFNAYLFQKTPVSYDLPAPMSDPTGNPYKNLYKDPHRNTVKQNIYKADAMLYYRLRVYEDIVHLRAGAGFGVGIHDVTDDSCGDRIIPYLNASLNWIVRCGKNLELVFSPTIAILPSEFDYSFVRLGGETNINPWLLNYLGLSLGIGYRF